MNTGDKQSRISIDQKVKWQHIPNKLDQIKKVKNLCEQVFGQESSSLMFECDQKKLVDVLKRLTLFTEKSPDEFTQVIDVVFKWIYIKLDENEKDVATAIKLYDFLAQLFSFLEA